MDFSTDDEPPSRKRSFGATSAASTGYVTSIRKRTTCYLLLGCAGVITVARRANSGYAAQYLFWRVAPGTNASVSSPSDNLPSNFWGSMLSSMLVAVIRMRTPLHAHLQDSHPLFVFSFCSCIFFQHIPHAYAWVVVVVVVGHQLQLALVDGLHRPVGHPTAIKIPDIRLVEPLLNSWFHRSHQNSKRNKIQTVPLRAQPRLDDVTRPAAHRHYH